VWISFLDINRSFQITSQCAVHRLDLWPKLGRLGVRAEESLFVGDRADMDVLGAQRIGMDAAWINRDGEPLPSGVAAPTYEIRDLGELATILNL